MLGVGVSVIACGAPAGGVERGTLSVGGQCTQKRERAFLPVELLKGVSQTGPRPLKVDSGSRGSQPAVKVREHQ